MAKRLTFFILLAMTLGMLTGFAINRSVSDPVTLTTVIDGLSIPADVFLRLIKMILAPLVFATLVGGITHMGDASALGRIGVRAIGLFAVIGFMALALGLLTVDLFKPGIGLGLPLPSATATSDLAIHGFNFHDFVIQIAPTSIADAMARDDLLQIVVFALFFGIALLGIGPRGKPIVEGVDALTDVMLTITRRIMIAAPFAVFGAVASAVAKQGIGLLATLGYFVAGFYVAFLLFVGLLYLIAAAAVGRRANDLFAMIRDPFFLAFSTATSEAAFPRSLDVLERFGVPSRIAGFVLPLGYSFNLAGSMIYCAFATMFIAQAYGVPIDLGGQIAMLLVLMVTSKGGAGVPRASLVVIAATLPAFHLPESGLLLILAVDHFLDMGRSAINVLANAVAAVVIARLERAFDQTSRDL